VRGGPGWRTLGALVAVGLMTACNSSTSPTADLPTVAVATGQQVLRVTFQGLCPTTDGRPLIPFVLTRVTVTRGNGEWIATATSPESGDVELRFSPSGRPVLMGSMPVVGTIKGVAIHNSDLQPGLPAANVRAAFGSDGGTLLNGFAFTPSALTPVAGVSGIGSGTVTLSDNEGRSCGGSAFSWALGAPPSA
jgi:hypothetical protein